ncbi:MAG: DNA polymerase III subunit delta [Rhodothermales bacterium]
MATKGLTYEQLETAFKHGNFKPVYFLYGQERFLMDQLQAQLIEHALAPHERDFNLDLIYGAESDANQVIGLCASFPAMAMRRVVIVRDFDQLKDNKRFTSYVKQPNPSAVVLLLCGKKPNLSMHPYRELKAKSEWAEFKPLYDNQIPGWISKRLKVRKIDADPAAIQRLSDYLGTDLQSIESEIDKLVTYCGTKRNITGDDVVQASGQTRDFNVFELQKAIGEARHNDAQNIAEQLLRQASNKRSEALMIVSVLTSYFTKLWKLTYFQYKNVPEKSLSSRVGVSPYFIKEYLQSLRIYNRSTIAGAFATLLAADYELKGGANRDTQLILTLLLRRLMPNALSNSPKNTAVSL